MSGKRHRLSRRAAGLAITGVSLYLVWPTLSTVYSAVGLASTLDLRWLVAGVAAEAASFVCVWSLMALVLDTRAWGRVASSQLAGNAVSLAVPAGAAVGAATQLRLLGRAGIDKNRARSGMAALSLLTTGSLFVLPVLAVPLLLLTGSIPSELTATLWVGAAMFATLAVLVATILRGDRLLRAIGVGIERLANRFRRTKGEGLAGHLLAERDRVRSLVARNRVRTIATVIGKPACDFLALMASLRAVHAHPDPALTMLAFSASEVAGMIPLTPGGLGFVEASLTAALVIAGVATGDAVVATAAYRLFSFWLPLAAGLVAYGWLTISLRRAGTPGPREESPSP